MELVGMTSYGYVVRQLHGSSLTGSLASKKTVPKAIALVILGGRILVPQSTFEASPHGSLCS